MSGQSKRGGELADLLGRQFVRVLVPNVGVVTGVLRQETVDHIVARLAEREAAIRDEAKAEAWDEGYRAGIADEATSQDWTGGQVTPNRVNPYRALLDGGNQS